MDIAFGIILLILGWILLIISWIMWDVEAPSALLALSSMMVFFASAFVFMYITEPYQVVVYNDYIGEELNYTIVTGEQHLTTYQGFIYFGIGFGLISMIWLIVRTFETFKLTLQRHGII